MASNRKRVGKFWQEIALPPFRIARASSLKRQQPLAAQAAAEGARACVRAEPQLCAEKLMGRDLESDFPRYVHHKDRQMAAEGSSKASSSIANAQQTSS